MSAVPRWALLSAAGAPLFLIGGWTVAQAAQADGFDPVRQTISALAATGADHRWIMTIGLAGLGLCHLTTALGLVSAARAGRGLLGLGGLATVLVAVFPQNATGSSTTHVVAAGVAFGALAVWPALAVPRRAASPLAREHRHRPQDGPAPVRRVALAAAAVLLGLVGWFGVEFFTDGAWIGLTERLAAAAEAGAPLAAVLFSRLLPRPSGPG
ncbi:DUF998 domain-containing protein [Micromonospora sp. C97]|uniref:DUF998 domain-containing protein n=1 Tax=Micromonospora sp. C97 TaxID=2824883 RepID=UPI001B399E06|nr:DUF998 domain-containing protein [Micromonospora sp. C97]MBQ1034589.1 DUF998 domain-containing protein [Micromonospora sp. C97]